MREGGNVLIIRGVWLSATRRGLVAHDASLVVVGEVVGSQKLNGGRRVVGACVDSVDCLESGAEAEGNKQPCPDWKSATGRLGKGRRQNRMEESRSVWGRPARLVNNCAAAGSTVYTPAAQRAVGASCSISASAPSQVGKLRGPYTVRMNTVPCLEPLAQVREG